MKKKDYQKMTMKVVQLQHRTSLLVGSPVGVRASRSSYGEANEGMSEGDDVWE